MFQAHNLPVRLLSTWTRCKSCLLCRVWHPRDHASFTLERPACGPLAAGAGATVRPGDLTCACFRVSHDIFCMLVVAMSQTACALPTILLLLYILCMASSHALSHLSNKQPSRPCSLRLPQSARSAMLHCQGCLQ